MKPGIAGAGHFGRAQAWLKVRDVLEEMRREPARISTDLPLLPMAGSAFIATVRSRRALM